MRFEIKKHNRGKNLKKIMKYINRIFLVIIIILSTFLVGTPILKENVYIVYTVESIYAIIYFSVKIIQKEKITLDIIDITIIALTLSTLIPLLASTYVTLTGTMYSILKYFIILIIYIIIKTEYKQDEKYRYILKNTLIISILILCIFGLDEITFNSLKQIKKLINYQNIQYDETRVTSLFSYPNAMAVVAGVGIFLCLDEILENKKIKFKICYSLVAIVMLATLILTYSRLVYIFFTIFIIIYFCILGKKSGIIKKINKSLIIKILIFFIILIAYLVIGLNIPDKIKVNKKYQKIFYEIEPNKEYSFVFDVKSTSEDDKNFIIKITQKNKYFDDIIDNEIKFGTFDGKKEINVVTAKDAAVIYMNIESKDKKSEITINKAQINNNELVLKYKILPTKLIQKIQSISLNNKSAWERLVFIKDGMKIIKDNWQYRKRQTLLWM